MEERKNLRRCATHFAFGIAIFIVMALLAGCVNEEETSPPRSATEQLLLSTAADQALANANLNMFAGRTVFFDFTYFFSYDSQYVEGSIRDAFSRAGALIVPDSKSADIIVEARSGAYSVDTNSAFLGIPSIPIPIPGTAETPVTPAVPFYQRQAYENKTHAHVYSSGALNGETYNKYKAILLVSWWTTDIPEKARPKYKHKYQIWFPQYDPQNLPPSRK
jgi:hypothetical protein